MKHKIKYYLNSEINQESTKQVFEEEGIGYKQVDDLVTILFLNSKNGLMKYYLKNHLIEIIKENDYKLTFQLNKKKDSTLIINDNEYKVVTFCSYLEIKNNQIKINYSLFLDENKIGDYITILRFEDIVD